MGMQHTRRIITFAGAGIALVAIRLQPLNGKIRRFNREIGNPLLLTMSERGGSYPAIIHHLGRSSGRSYATPVVAEPVSDGFVIPLPYGADTDWCRNVL